MLTNLKFETYLKQEQKMSFSGTDLYYFDADREDPDPVLDKGLEIGNYCCHLYENLRHRFRNGPE